MSRVSDPDLLVLLTLRLRTLADLDSIATAIGPAGDATADVLSELERRGLVRHRDGRVQGWMLTPDGRQVCAAGLAGELDAAGVRDEVVAAYQRFLSVNQQLLDLCTDWQLRDGESTGATTFLSTGLGEVDAVGQAACRDLVTALDRFAGYATRLSAARTAVVGGDTEWLTGPTIDSYHTVWFELHENLLATLGLERGREGDGRTPGPSSLQEAH